MAKSWLIGARQSGQSYAAGVTGFFQLFSTVEDDQIGTIRVFIPEALTLRNFAVRIGANSLSGNATFTVRKNDTTDTGLAVVFATTETDIEKRVTGVNVAFAKDDDWVGKTVTASGTGTILHLGCSAECQPDNASNTLSFMACKSVGSTNNNVAGDFLFAPFGRRITSTTEIFAGTESTGISWQSIGSFRALYFQIATGTITWTGTMVAKTRVNGADGGCSITLADTNDNTVLVDTTGFDDLVDGDELNYVHRNGAGSGSNNVESIGVWLRSTAGVFLMHGANRTGTRLLASTTHYIAPGGEWETSGIPTTESVAQMSAPFAMTISQMQVMSDRERNSSASTVTLRQDGAATELAVSFPASGTGSIGISEDSGSVAVAVDDLLATQFVTGTQTNRDYNWIVYLAAAAAGGVSNPPSRNYYQPFLTR